MKKSSATLLSTLVVFISLMAPALSAPIDQAIPTLPPSPTFAMANALQKSRIAFAKAKLLDQQRKSAWIAAQETIRQTRKVAQQYQAIGETAWSNQSMGYEDMDEAVTKGEEAEKRVQQLEKQAIQQQLQMRISIKRLLQEAEQSERGAQVIYQTWLDNHGQQTIDAARSYRKHLEYSNEIQQLRLVETQTNLQAAKDDLARAIKEQERDQQERKERTATLDQAIKTIQQTLQTAGQTTESFFSTSAMSHEELQETFDLEETLNKKLLEATQEKSTLEAMFQEKLGHHAAHIKQLEQEIVVQQGRLKEMETQTAALRQQAATQGQRVDSLARLVDAHWPQEKTPPSGNPPKE
ncbi:MAG: hypothetical protein HQL75_16295 [Magnetococcales bacterium]|nr:hypothetical protein [Magnetococcales bacterium]